jgi:glycosyltransferase involved in cell wall biosynthesis
VPLADGPLLYQACTLFAFPSRYEGFGLPPLEAMACGAPVVVSDASSLPEVVGDAALRVPPDDVVAWAAAIGRLLSDPALRADLRAQGLAQAARFSYQRVAQETLAVLERAANSSR